MDKLKRVMVQVSYENTEKIIKSLKKSGFVQDKEYGRIRLPLGLLIRGNIPDKRVVELRKLPGVVGVWSDQKIQPLQ